MKNPKIKKEKDLETKKIANILFEYGHLAKTPRSGFQLLGTGDQSVAEHVNRTTFIAYVLAELEGDVDVGKVLKMALLHDISEARVSDLHYVHQKYMVKKEDEAISDIVNTVPFGKDVLETIEEYEKRESKESIIVKEADNLEWIISLKEQVDIGNTRALMTMGNAMKRLKTKNAIRIAYAISGTDSNDWWFVDKDSDWWVNRNRK